MPIYSSAFPFPAGSQEELATFKRLQANFAPQFEAVFPQHHAEKTVVVIPSLTLDQEILSKVKGHVYYEERLLCLMLVGSSRVDLQACKLEYSIVSPK